MTIRGFAPKPILAFDEVQFPSKNLFKLKFYSTKIIFF